MDIIKKIIIYSLIVSVVLILAFISATNPKDPTLKQLDEKREKAMDYYLSAMKKSTNAKNVEQLLEAEELFAKSFNIYPDFLQPGRHFWLGYTFQKLGSCQLALDEYQKEIDLNTTLSSDAEESLKEILYETYLYNTNNNFKIIVDNNPSLFCNDYDKILNYVKSNDEK